MTERMQILWRYVFHRVFHHTSVVNTWRDTLDFNFIYDDPKPAKFENGGSNQKNKP